MTLVPVAVMPARNEAHLLEASCRSLGFGASAVSTGCRLIVIDNGSSDATASIARAIASRSMPGMMEVFSEQETGHVPARHAGAMAAMRWGAALGIEPASLILLQVDADTEYGEGYAQAMVRQADHVGAGHLIEGSVEPPAPAADACAAFRDLEINFDCSLGSTIDFDHPCDVVVDDKVVGMRLTDYLEWGGHRREYESNGDEVLAETTRLFMRAFAKGARRSRAEDATAVTSQRRIIEDPALAFATAGYPHTRAWAQRWHAQYSGPRDLNSFRAGSSAYPEQAARTRPQHLIALFGLLPAYMQTLVPSAAEPSELYGPELVRMGLAGSVIEPGQALSRILSWSLLAPDDVLPSPGAL